MFPDALTTARLRPVEAGDAPAIFASYAQDPEVTRFLTWRPHGALAETRAYVASCLALPPERARVYAIVGRVDGRLRGCLHLRWPAPHRAEVGYCLARAFWGQGLMTEALRAAADRALAAPGVFRIGAVWDIDNPASARVMEIDLDVGRTRIAFGSARGALVPAQRGMTMDTRIVEMAAVVAV